MSRILPLIGSQGNRELLSKWIQRQTDYEVVTYEDADPLSSQFDLCIVDGPALIEYRSEIIAYRDRADPEFVPVLLLVPNEYSQRLNVDIWDVVDDIIWTSVGEQTDSLDTFEFRGRIHSLLRVRSMSRRLFEDQQRLKVLHRVLRHNLRNSLNVVQGAAESIDVPEGEQYLDMIVQNATRLIGHSEKAQDVDQILEKGVKQEVNLGGLVPPLIGRFRDEYPIAEITVNAETHVQVTAIQGIKKAIEELIQNALIHSTSSRPTVTVDVMCKNDHGVVSVSDSGPLISEQDRRVLRGDLEPTALDHGSGLGLWLVVWTVRRSNGDVEYLATEAGGNQIGIQLPLRRNERT